MIERPRRLLHIYIKSDCPEPKMHCKARTMVCLLNEEVPFKALGRISCFANAMVIFHFVVNFAYIKHKEKNQ